MLWELKNKHRVHREKRNYAWLQICKQMEPKWESFTNPERLRSGPKAIFNHLLQTPKLKTSQEFSTLCHRVLVHHGLLLKRKIALSSQYRLTRQYKRQNLLHCNVHLGVQTANVPVQQTKCS
ncbi:hypothetical protein GDO81_002764 [Engystomops pustulosus]|uniref:Uncharacterized protein n=1 Tax=Engystomops pustulosus TaxID=76066 RepID=A0AAV7DPA2_ENGPU|nr:hypothetical protein GDO81_002764 [Engystomops pustulosus]